MVGQRAKEFERIKCTGKEERLNITLGGTRYLLREKLLNWRPRNSPSSNPLPSSPDSFPAISIVSLVSKIRFSFKREGHNSFEESSLRLWGEENRERKFMAKSQEHPNRTRDIKSGQESRHDGRAVMQPEQRAKVAFHSVAAESLYRILFSIGHKVGFHITRNNFYSPLPDTRNLPATLWSKTSDLLGVNLNEERQLGRLDIFESQFRKEYKEFPREATPIPFQYHVNNRAFERVDGELLYCMIRHFKPRRFLEIGSGNSTFLAAQAILKNVSEDPTNSCDLTAVDPFSSQVHQQGFPGLSTVLRCGVQELPFSRFEQLEPNDILFIASSPILKIGNNLHHLFLQVLPPIPKS